MPLKLGFIDRHLEQNMLQKILYTNKKFKNRKLKSEKISQTKMF